MADQKVNIKVSTTGAKKSKDQLSGVSGSIRKLGSAIVATSAAYFGTRGLISAISTSTELAGIQEQAEKQLATALGRTSTALLNQASALQKVTIFGDEATIQQQAFLASIGFTEEKIKTIIPVAMDLATATGMTLESAVRNTAKTFSGLAGELGELVPQLRGLTAEQMKAGEAVKVMADLFGGQAQAQAKTYAGSVEQLKGELSDMAEGIGRLLIPAFEKLAPHIKGMIKFYSDLFNIQEKVNSQSSQQTVELEKVNSLIKFQRDRLEGLSKSKLFEQRLTENGLGLAERARNQGRKIVDQYVHEKTELGKLIAEKRNLKIELEEELKIREALNRSHENTLKLRRADIDMSIEYVDVVDPATKGNRLFAASYGDIADASTSALKQTSDLLAVTAGSSKSQQIQAMKLAQFAAIADTASGVMKAFKQGGTLGFITGAGIAATGAAQVATIQQAIANAQAAETGFDGIVNKPTLFMTGENNKAERVSVTPLQGPNINGPQGGGMTLNITAPLIDEHILDTILPAIENAQKQNLA